MEDASREEEVEAASTRSLPPTTFPTRDLVPVLLLLMLLAAESIPDEAVGKAKLPWELPALMSKLELAEPSSLFTPPSTEPDEDEDEDDEDDEEDGDDEEDDDDDLDDDEEEEEEEAEVKQTTTSMKKKPTPAPPSTKSRAQRKTSGA